MSGLSVSRSEPTFPVRMVLGSAICLLSLPLAAMAGVMGMLTFEVSDKAQQFVLFTMGSSWPLACILGPLAAWGLYLMGARRWGWIFLVPALMCDIVGLAVFMSVAHGG